MPPKSNSASVKGSTEKTSEGSQTGTPCINMHSNEEGSVVSSITGGGFDQEIVEELHMALRELKAELVESRAEAARAVKVAEQAIQSAEKSSSKDWNNSVTHKAAEAAALAQKRSAEAMATARMAEERLEVERKNASIWRKQAEAAEEKAGHWQTRAAAAEVQRAALAEVLEGERKEAATLLASMKERFESSDGKQKDALEETMGRSGTAEQAPQAVLASQSEIERLRSKLAMESAARRKLLHEVQDLRGTVRVYCRPRASLGGASTISTPSQEALLLNRPGFKDAAASSFQFDGILNSEMDQQDLYDEIDEVCLSVLDGYNVCVMAYGQTGTGKTYTLLGEVAYGNDVKDPTVSIHNYGLHLRAAQQFFSVLKHRSDRYKDIVSFTIAEVHNERICDLLVGTEIGESNGGKESSGKITQGRIDSQDGSVSQSTKPSKLEIRTNHNGETVVDGLLSIEVFCLEDVLRAWKDCLGKRKARLSEQGIDFVQHDRNSHVICTLSVESTNTATGVGTVGKIQFVDLASADLFPSASKGSKPKNTSSPDLKLSGFGKNQGWHFSNRSLATLNEVVNARSQYQRSVPYRNSTITHLLSDSLEADTKVIMVACVSTEPKDLQQTACTLKFAQNMRKVAVGKATKHTFSEA